MKKNKIIFSKNNYLMKSRGFVAINSIFLFFDTMILREETEIFLAFSLKSSATSFLVGWKITLIGIEYAFR